MNVRSALRGRSISDVEVTNVSQHGFWVLVGGRELFLPFKRFDMRTPVRNHLLNERAHLLECGVRLLGGEVAHECNPMRRWRILA